MLTLTAEQRRSRIVEKLRLDKPGIEYGPLCRPIVTKDRNVRYVDFTSREYLAAQYANSQTVNIDQICEIDIVTGGRSITEFIEPCSINYVVVSHVLEHVPDMIGWFFDNLSILVAGGRISIAYPDKRFTFDIGRRQSAVPDMAAAYFEKRTKPGLEQIANHFMNARRVSVAKAWRSSESAENYPLCHSTKACFNLMAKAASSGEYIDCHCWVFDDVGFIRTMEQAIGTFTLPMKIIEFHPTRPNTLEFFVTFEKLP